MSRDVSGILDARTSRGITAERTGQIILAAGFCPSFAFSSPSKIRRAQGMPGADTHPRVLRAKRRKERTQVVTGTPNSPAFPARVVYGLWRALPGVPGFLVPVILRKVLARLDLGIGRPGPHAFAVRVRSHSSHASSTRPSQPASRFVTIGRNVLWMRRDGGMAGWREGNMYFRKTEVIYFCWDPLNAPIMLRRLAKSDFPRRGLPPPTEPLATSGR